MHLASNNGFDKIQSGCGSVIMFLKYCASEPTKPCVARSGREGATRWPELDRQQGAACAASGALASAILCTVWPQCTAVQVGDGHQHVSRVRGGHAIIAGMNLLHITLLAMPCAPAAAARLPSDVNTHAWCHKLREYHIMEAILPLLSTVVPPHKLVHHRWPGQQHTVHSESLSVWTAPSASLPCALHWPMRPCLLACMTCSYPPKARAI